MHSLLAQVTGGLSSSSGHHRATCIKDQALALEALSLILQNLHHVYKVSLVILGEGRGWEGMDGLPLMYLKLMKKTK